MIRLIIFSVIAGIASGSVLGTSAAPLGVIGTSIIQFIKVMAVPLVFFAIVEGIITSDITARKALRLFKVVLINGTIAACIGLILSNILQPGVGLFETLTITSTEPFKPPVKTIDMKGFVGGLIPESIISPFLQNNVLGVVFIAVLIGAAIRTIQKGAVGDHNLSVPFFYGMKIFDHIIHWAIHLIPIGIFAVIAKTVGEHGFSPFGHLAMYVAVAAIGLTLQVVVVYTFWISVVRKIPLSKFYAAAKKPLLYAFGVNSSLATLPITLHALDSLEVGRASSRLGACVGTNLNNDGILLYEAMAVLFVAQAYGIELSISEQIITVLMCMVAAIGVAGIPEAGVISLSLVLGTIGLPIEIVPLLLTVDWFVARLRSVVNVCSDMTVSIALDSELDHEKLS